MKVPSRALKAFGPPMTGTPEEGVEVGSTRVWSWDWPEAKVKVVRFSEAYWNVDITVKNQVDDGMPSEEQIDDLIDGVLSGDR